MNIKEIRDNLFNDQSVFGIFSPYENPTFAELLGKSGFDFIIFDGEHGAISAADTSALSMAAENSNCTAFIRPPAIDSRYIGRCLDFGAKGIIMPMINTKLDGEKFLNASLYPPHGARGLAMTRSLSFGLDGDIATKIEEQNDTILTIAQIETQEAVSNLDEILSLDRLDVIFVGPADLSVSLGIAFQFQHPDFVKTIVSIAERTRAAGKHLGVLITDPAQVSMLHALGFRLFAGYSDMIMIDASQNFLSGCRSHASPRQ